MNTYETNCIVYLDKNNYSVYSLSKMKLLSNRLGVLNSSKSRLRDLAKTFLAQGLASVDSAIEAVEPNASNYWHFMAYVLPTIMENRDKANYFLIANTTEYIIEYISLLGININRLVPIRGRPIVAERLNLSGSLLPCYDKHYAPYAGLKAVAHKLKEYRMHRSSQMKVYIDRLSSNNGSINRRVMPDPSWKVFIEGLGFRVVYVEKMTVREQIEIFSEADVVMAMHGAALTNCIYMHREATVIELMHENGVENGYLDMFRTISNMMGLDFHRVPCQPFLSPEDEKRLQLVTGNPSTNPLPVKHTHKLSKLAY